MDGVIADFDKAIDNYTYEFSQSGQGLFTRLDQQK